MLFEGPQSALYQAAQAKAKSTEPEASVQCTGSIGRAKATKDSFTEAVALRPGGAGGSEKSHDFS